MAVWDIDQGGADAVALEIRDAGGDAIACTVDVSRSAAIHNATAETLASFGSIDILVHKASIHDD
ncbi:SDR family NAD(P)-dependent oxidoreductase [Rhizobium sp. Root1203]|uniref:SDR family NAD(P)-dependent oxidoreductase n=1 Tax=Rhizobium sp. Root1203 TaxID=1736427 RepID=UPI001910A730|nr:SDR family NAD(P)-dependent oxidoreductase [Rhizobium sp. Root1203]